MMPRLGTQVSLGKWWGHFVTWWVEVKVLMRWDIPGRSPVGNHSMGPERDQLRSTGSIGSWLYRLNRRERGPRTAEGVFCLRVWIRNRFRPWRESFKNHWLGISQPCLLSLWQNTLWSLLYPYTWLMYFVTRLGAAVKGLQDTDPTRPPSECAALGGVGEPLSETCSHSAFPGWPGFQVTAGSVGICRHLHKRSVVCMQPLN